MQPVLRHIANLWTFMGGSPTVAERTLEQKLDAIQEAGFDGVCWAPSPELCEGVKDRGLIFLGGMATGDSSQFKTLLNDLQQGGALHINVQLGTHDTTVEEALRLTLELMREADKLHLLPAIETHRGTCTETPEKYYALADTFSQETGTLLSTSWDFSHFAVVKHLVPQQWNDRLLLRPDLIQQSQQFHFRPFNGHHVQLPITDGRGNLTQEVQDWLPFAEAVLRCWLDANRNTDREIFICPELGPVEGGYALSTFPDSWEEAKVLRLEIDRLWQRVISS